LNTRNTFWSPRFRLGWLLILIAAVNSLGWTLLRWNYENSLTGAQLTMDYDDTRVMSDAFHVPHREMLQKLKEKGVTSIALYELSLVNLQDYGRLSLVEREQAIRLYPSVNWKAFDPARYRLLITTTPENQSLLPLLMRKLQAQSLPAAPPRVVTLSPRGAGLATQYGILIPASKQLLNDAQMGFDPAQVAFVRSAGLGVTARISNSLNLDLDRVRALLDDAKAAGARVVIFSEDEVLGYTTMDKIVAREMKKRGLLFGNIEITKQRGWQEFANLTDGQLVRVHSVGGDEAAKVQMDVLVERFARAIKERDIRVAYIRFGRQFKGKYSLPVNAAPSVEPDKEETALQQNLEMIGDIRDEISHQPLPFAWLRPGLQATQAQPFGNYPLDTLTNALGSERAAKWTLRLGRFLSGLGGLGAGLLMLNLFFDLKRRTQTLWIVAGVLLTAVLSLSAGMGAKLMALEVGCLFSVIGLLWGGLPLLWRDEGELEAAPAETSRWRAWLTGARVLLQTSALTLLGPLLIVALLNYWKYFSGADKYFWPKGTQLIPLVLVALAFAAEAFPHRVLEEGAAAAQNRLIARIRLVLARPLTIGLVLGSIVLLVLGMIWIARTGNDSGMEVSSLELRFRAILEQVFITRPRTKEIILGHPAMIFAVWFALRRQWPGLFAAALATTIGQADMLNTFCHQHTPLFYSVLRSFHALWLGILIGGAALWLWTLIVPRAWTVWQTWSTPDDIASDGASSKTRDKVRV
jgi:hypothetical protein